LAEVLPEFTQFCSGSSLVGYTVRLDRAFLTRGESEASQTLANSPWLDVRQVARWLAAQPLPPAKEPPASDNLGVLAAYYGIPVPQKHHALADAFITAQIWQRQLAQLKALGYSQLPPQVEAIS
jgi:DNA polymerase-3 subunit epsilon